MASSTRIIPLIPVILSLFFSISLGQIERDPREKDIKNLFFNPNQQDDNGTGIGDKCENYVLDLQFSPTRDINYCGSDTAAVDFRANAAPSDTDVPMGGTSVESCFCDDVVGFDWNQDCYEFDCDRFARDIWNPIRSESFDNNLDYPTNFLNMMYQIGGPYEIHPALRKAMEILLILHADHEQNCSTTAARVVGSAHADPYTVIAAGCGALCPTR